MLRGPSTNQTGFPAASVERVASESALQLTESASADSLKEKEWDQEKKKTCELERTFDQMQQRLRFEKEGPEFFVGDLCGCTHTAQGEIVTDYFPPYSPLLKDLWPLKHVITTMRRHEMTNKKTVIWTRMITMPMKIREHPQIVTPETIYHQDIWSELWGEFTWST